MKVVLVDAPQSMLDERRKLGLDKRDEMWDGVLHFPPQPSEAHLQLRQRFVRAVEMQAASRGLHVIHDTRLQRTETDYRVPHLQFLAEGGVANTVVVVEIRIGPEDETYKKLDFY